jgi:ribonuclease HI
MTINTDGAARGNPGPAAYAFVIARDGQAVIEEAGCLGKTTNNFAEYTALVRALERAAELGGERLVIRSDSELLVKQMNGQYKVKNEQLKELYDEARALLKRFQLVTIQHVRRAENSQADRLCNEALDGLRESAIPSSTTNGLEQARSEAVACLRAVATAWARGNLGQPTPEAVWDQLWQIMKERGLLRP